MAKSIKVIKCPNCGSTRNTEIKPDYYRCSNCDTEYYLDNDDINININSSPKPVPAPNPVDKKRAILVGLMSIGIVFTVLIINIISDDNRRNAVTGLKKKEPYGFTSAGSIVYQNTHTGKAVYMRMGREDIEEANHNIDYVNTHAVFIDPVTAKQFKDKMLLPHIRRLDDYFPSFMVYRDKTIYMLYPGARLFTVDRNTDDLVEITTSQFKKHPELSAGLASIGLAEDYMNLLTNDGNKYYYVPAKDFLTNEYDSFKKELRSIQPDTCFRFDGGKLVRLTADGSGKEPASADLTPGRKYFSPEILFQDKTSLIITTGANAADNAPSMVQSIDAHKGNIIWTLPAKTFTYRSAARCNEGYAFEYFSGEDQDYISGVLVVSPAGTIVNDYLIKRGD